MARNLIPNPVSIHLSEACGLHVGNQIGIDIDPIRPIDHQGVCMINHDQVKSTVQTGSLVRVQIVDKVLTDHCQVETCRSYTIAGRLFDILYPDLLPRSAHPGQSEELVSALRQMQPA